MFPGFVKLEPKCCEFN